VSGKTLMARMVWSAITTGEVTFPDGKAMRLSPQDWKDFVKWAYQHIDGPPTQNVDLTSGGEKITWAQFIGTGAANATDAKPDSE